jgi:small subunit ribosomal protein S9
LNLMAEKIFTGRRKSAVARARVSRGSGQFTLNGRSLEDYFPTEKMRSHVLAPFGVVEQDGQWDVVARIHGGGTTGQAGALRLAIARALAEDSPEWRTPLKQAGYLTRDARKVERKKYGLKKARRAPQFSKR